MRTSIAITPVAGLLLALATAAPASAQSSAGSLKLEDCRISAGPEHPSLKALCGTLTRPLNPDDPDGETIELYVAVVAALTLEPAPDPVVPIAGGPGQASSTFYAGTFGAFEALRRERDILLIDQRGTGRSAPLNCDIDEDVVQIEFSIEETLEGTERCLDALPHDPRFFTTSVAVTDIEAVRVALGYGPVNLYGVSYGSRVAQHFARRYPESTRSVILDGVVPPQLALGPAIALEAQRALDYIFARCAEDAGCAETFPDLGPRFDALLAELRAQPVTVSLPHPVSGRPESIEFSDDALTGAVRIMTYHPLTIAMLPLMISEAADGNFLPMAAQFINIRDSLTESLSGGMHNAVVCTEDAPFFSGEAVSDQELAATYIGPLMRESLVAMCSIWPAGVLDDDFKQPLSTAVPVLLLSGEVDPITPPAYAEMAAVDIEQALLLTGRQQGHGLAPRGCTPDVMAEFVAELDVTTVDTSCFERHFAMPFFLGFSGPSP